jgi:CheY-like chemotaxis protein
MNKRILWVDDEIEFLRAHIRFLETRGYNVTAAQSGDEAIRLIEENAGAYDIVLLDKQMPIKSGIVTLEEIKTMRPDLPVVMITGYQHSGDSLLVKKSDGYLTKPVDPNQILLECKRIIDSRQQVCSGKVADRYLRAYTENQARLNERMDAPGLINLHNTLAMWDIELEGITNEGVRQMHAGIKSDCGKKFCDYVAENYSGWIKGQRGRPLMPVDITGKVIAPELSGGRSVLQVILSGMRLDQFIAVEPDLKRNFAVTSARFMSLLPSVSDYCLTSLLSGSYPDTLHLLEPDVFKPNTDVRDTTVIERLAGHGLAHAGIENVKITCADTKSEIKQQIKTILDAMKKTPAYGVVTLDVMELFVNQNSPQATIPSDAELRERIRLWFVTSDIFKMMKEACGSSCTIVLTSDHGHVFCDRAAEIYETSKIGDNLRYVFAKEAAGDERAVLLVEELSHFRLPPRAQRMKCFMARENYYFTLAEKFARQRKTVPGAFRCGGVSPQEMIMPVYICRPKRLTPEA